MLGSRKEPEVIDCKNCGHRNFKRPPPLPLRNYLTLIVLFIVYLVWDSVHPLGKLEVVCFGSILAVFAFLAARDRLRFNAGGGPLFCTNCKSDL